MQLQPAVVVTARPPISGCIPTTRSPPATSSINGCRRLAAAHKYGRTDLAIVVNDDIARDRITLISASIAENVDRQDFDVIEEAKAVEALVAGVRPRRRGRRPAAQDAGLGVAAAGAARAGAGTADRACAAANSRIREARALARVPLEQQVARWQAALDNGRNPTRRRSGSDGSAHGRSPTPIRASIA